jgi:hypothetical protein
MTHLRRVHPTRVRFVPPKTIPNDQYRRRSDAIELAYVVPPKDVPAVESDHGDDAAMAEGDAAIGDSSGISDSNAPQEPTATTVYYPDAGKPHGNTFDLDDDEIDPFRPFNSECYGGVWFAAVSLRYRYGTKKEVGREVFACDGNVIFF